jgi:hypothetical protein
MDYFGHRIRIISLKGENMLTAEEARKKVKENLLALDASTRENIEMRIRDTVANNRSYCVFDSDMRGFFPKAEDFAWLESLGYKLTKEGKGAYFSIRVSWKEDLNVQ